MSTAPAQAAPGPAPGKGTLGAKDSTSERIAKAKFEEGLALSDEAKWAEALEAFRQSNRLLPHATVQYNIAVTLRALGKYVEAEHSAEQTLADIASKKLQLKQPKLKTDIETLLKEVKAKVAVVAVRVTPEQATVEVDGSAPERREDGRLEIDPGKHVFVVSAKDYQTTTVTQTIEPGESEISLKAPKNLPTVGPGATPEEETPWYATGWFWGTTGSVVAVGIAVAVIVVVLQPAAQSPAEPPAATVSTVVPAGIRF